MWEGATILWTIFSRHISRFCVVSFCFILPCVDFGAGASSYREIIPQEGLCQSLGSDFRDEEEIIYSSEFCIKQLLFYFVFIFIL